MFDFIIDFFITCMDWVAEVIGSYGWAVVIFTVLLRLLLSPLDYKTRRDTRRQQTQMAVLRPELDALEKRYRNNPEKLRAKQQELYAKHKFNPMSTIGGCIIPMILQFGLLILFFQAFRAISDRETFAVIDMLREGEVTTEGWFWVQNIWQPDTTSATVLPDMNTMFTTLNSVFTSTPEWASGTVSTFTDAFGSDALNRFSLAYNSLYTNATGALGTLLPSGANGYYILPILAAASSLLNTFVNPPSAQPGADDQAKQGKIMTYMMAGLAFFFCLTNSAAFAIYWVASNLVATGNNFVINKMLDAKEKKPAATTVKAKAVTKGN